MEGILDEIDNSSARGARRCDGGSRSNHLADGEDPAANPELTGRELEILHRLVDGHTNQHIAVQLGLSPKTVMHHTGSVYRKLGVGGRVEAIAYALRAGVVE